MGSPSQAASVQPPFKSTKPELSQLVRQLRQVLNLTQEQFAALLGVAYGTINRWENGRIQPSRLALKQIKAVLKDLTGSPDSQLQAVSQELLERYFSGKELGAND